MQSTWLIDLWCHFITGLNLIEPKKKWETLVWWELMEICDEDSPWLVVALGIGPVRAVYVNRTSARRIGWRFRHIGCIAPMKKGSIHLLWCLFPLPSLFKQLINKGELRHQSHVQPRGPRHKNYKWLDRGEKSQRERKSIGCVFIHSDRFFLLFRQAQCHPSLKTTDWHWKSHFARLLHPIHTML